MMGRGGAEERDATTTTRGILKLPPGPVVIDSPQNLENTATAARDPDVPILGFKDALAGKRTQHSYVGPW